METKYQVVLLAGGMGSRLAPITDDLPKPLVPVCGVPVLTRLTEQLQKNGFTDALLTVCALPEAFDAYRDPYLRLHTVRGSIPLGSAGCVRASADLLADTVLILSGDTVLLPENASVLRELYERHIREHRRATLLLTHAQDPGEFGIVSLDAGRIVGFSEKPSWRDTFSDLISTGIYILDRTLLEAVPPELCFDFGKDLFPLLLQKGVPLHGEIFPGQWWDIGTPESYFRCNMALSGGETVVGTECLLAPSAQVAHSVLHDRVTVGSGARVEGSILCSGVVVGENCVIPAGCVVGANTVLSPGAVLQAGVRLRGGLQIRENATVGDRFGFGVATQRLFGDECIIGSRAELDSGFCLRLGRACKQPGVPLRLGVLHGSTAGARLYAELVSRGAQDAGAQVWELGDGFPAVTAFAVSHYGLDMAIYVDLQESVGKTRFWLCDADGLPLSRRAQREITRRLADQSFDTCMTPLPVVIPEREDRLLCRYCAWLQEQVGTLSGVRFSVTRRDDAGEFLYANASELGAAVSYGEAGDSFTVSPDGRRACAYTAGGKPLSYWHLVALVAAESDESVVCLPARVPNTVAEYLRNMGKQLCLYTDSATAERRNAKKSPYVNDGVLLCLLVTKQLQRQGTEARLDTLASALPEFFVRKKELSAPADAAAADRRAARILALTRHGAFPARVFYPNGCVSFFPNAAGGYTLLAEATYGGAEIAEELFARAEELLR